MTVEQYSALVELMPQIEKALEKKGETISRPNYESTARDVTVDDQAGQQQQEGYEAEEEVEAEAEAENVEVKPKNGKRRKANIEATSDEDEED